MRKIRITQWKDRLRWGTSTSGDFTIREAYNLVAGHSQLPKMEIWEKNITSKALSESLNFPLVDGTRKNSDMGKSPQKIFLRSLNMPPLPSLVGRH
jgi:hypothetical protein